MSPEAPMIARLRRVIAQKDEEIAKLQAVADAYGAAMAYDREHDQEDGDEEEGREHFELWRALYDAWRALGVPSSDGPPT